MKGMRRGPVRRAQRRLLRAEEQRQRLLRMERATRHAERLAAARAAAEAAAEEPMARPELRVAQDAEQLRRELDNGWYKALWPACCCRGRRLVARASARIAREEGARVGEQGSLRMAAETGDLLVPTGMRDTRVEGAADSSSEFPCFGASLSCRVPGLVPTEWWCEAKNLMSTLMRSQPRRGQRI